VCELIRVLRFLQVLSGFPLGYLGGPLGLSPTGANLDPKLELALTSFLRDNADIFTWSPSDMSGVPRELAEHGLEVNKTARPIKQKLQ
jgi:hypothetical protein